ncbi:MAG: hypothetical protein JXA69_14135 [Phycisphaerae bacterium]|nr:hypothetical protein [Phycisphaerae bacterium]
MAKFSLRRYDVQATVSVALSAAAFFFILAMAAMIVTKLNLEMKVISYGKEGLRMPAIYLSGLAAFTLGVAGFGFGMNSAGQRRNDKPRRSWIGFFLGAGAITLSLILLALFRMWGEEVIR